MGASRKLSWTCCLGNRRSSFICPIRRLYVPNVEVGYRWRIFSQPRRLPYFCLDSRKRFDRNLLVTTLHAHNHLILVSDRHFQLPRFVFLHDRAVGADPSVQKGLEPLIAISGEVESAVVGRNRQRDAAGEAGRAAVSM